MDNKYQEFNVLVFSEDNFAEEYDIIADKSHNLQEDNFYSYRVNGKDRYMFVVTTLYCSTSNNPRMFNHPEVKKVDNVQIVQVKFPGNDKLYDYLNFEPELKLCDEIKGKYGTGYVASIKNRNKYNNRIFFLKKKIVKPTDETQIKINKRKELLKQSQTIIVKEKENKSMNINFNKIFNNLKFGKLDTVKLSVNGMAFYDGNTYKTYDANANVLTDVGDLVFDFECFAVPTPTNQVNVGDYIVLNDNYCYVKAIAEVDNTLTVVNIKTNEISTILPTKNIFGVDMVSKIINPYGNMFNFGTENNMFNNPMMMMMFMGDNNDTDDMTKMMLMNQMCGGDNTQMNPMMLMMMLNK